MSPDYAAAAGAGNDPMTQRFWRSVGEGRLEFQLCSRCGHRRWPPARTCPECLSPRWEWRLDDGRGTVWSHCRYVDPSYDNEFAKTPYTIVAVELTSGPFLQGMLEGATEALAIGAAVSAAPRLGEDGKPRVVFCLDGW